MGLEIERKFLVDETKWLDASATADRISIIQGYLLDFKKHILRVRSQNNGLVYLTYKGPNRGITRVEKELRIPKFLGNMLLKLCKSTIVKTRTLIPVGSGLCWEVDDFSNLTHPLLLAEIELPYEHYPLDKPDWLGEEVSTDPYYYNSNLINKVFKTWK